MVFMHVMVVFVNCDLVCAEVCAEEIAKVLETNLVGEALIVIIC